MSEPRELVLLTALRRAERKPDPLAIEFDTHSVRAVTFPRLPTISFQLKNVDVSELFSLSGGAIFGFGGRYQCYRIDATDPRGVHLAPLPNPLFSCVGSVHEVTLAPGEVLDPELDLDLTQYVAAPQPGEYRVCVQFHSEENIAGAAGVEGWILATSQSFVVRLDPLSVRLSAHEVASMKEWIAAIDVQDQVLLIREHWSPGLTFFGEPTSAADRLFRAGWNGLPVLLEALDDEHLAQGRRACIVALLWDIAGIFDPSSDPGGVEDLYIGPWSERWPSTLKESAQMRSEFADRDQAEWAKRIAAFSDRWRALRSCVQLEIID